MTRQAMPSGSLHRPIEAARTPPARGELGQLNGVMLSAAQIDAARRLLALNAARNRGDPVARASTLQAYARQAGLGDAPVVAAALHARIAALDRWILAHDPTRQSDPSALNQAAAQMPLSDTASGVAFEGDAFQELVLFIEDLPW